MGTPKTILLATVGAMTLTACGDGFVLDSWTQESGAFIDEGAFGNPTMNNRQVHSGTGNIVVDLNNKFGADVDPMVNFAFDSATLDESAKATLREQANWIKQFPEVRFRVYGHTDLVGSDAYNKSLGLRRARTVVNYLVAQGISRSRLEAVASFGETQPLVVTQERERRNRRTVTEVTGFVNNTSGPLNGKYARIIWRQYVGSAGAKPKTTDADLGEVGNTGGS